MSATAEAELKHEFWTHMSASPFVMLELDNAPHSAAPMTAQLDEHAHSAIWFFTSRDSAFARMGSATATFVAKNHALFARFAGHLVEETSRALLDKFWTDAITAWFPQGKNSPQVLLLRMELGEASIWDAKMDVLSVTKMLLGIDVRDEMKGHHANTSL
ncbi:MAG TPA: pyridoxamine 5'-phosphate oxidase family protein [Steroidobacteraceae bacterium]|jgi:general stress protein 26